MKVSRFAPSTQLCALLFVLLLSWWGERPVPAASAAYADRGKIDFDTAMKLLAPYGTWAQVEGLWAFTPKDHPVPYTYGRWLYTEYGWYWQGGRPESWLTEHYGYWKRGAEGLWAWYPGPDWLPETVELRATSTSIGWRSGEVDRDGVFVEAPSDRFAKTDEWTFVSRSQFTRPITPELVADSKTAARLLDDSTEATHVYVTYRAIDRPGPHPADFLALAGSNGMFPRKIETPPAPPLKQPVSTRAAQGQGAGASVAAPAATAATTDDSGEPPSPADSRQVPYWITMSLPTYDAAPPEDALPNQLFLYRPDIYQDQDGIERRIRLVLNPGTQTLLGQRLRDVLGGAAAAKGSTSGSGGNGTGNGGSNPFRSPFDDSFQGGSKSAASPAVTNASRAPAPSGRQPGLPPAVAPQP